MVAWVTAYCFIYGGFYYVAIEIYTGDKFPSSKSATRKIIMFYKRYFYKSGGSLIFSTNSSNQRFKSIWIKIISGNGQGIKAIK